MNSPQQPSRRDIRYPLHMPVTLKLAHQRTQARSENISLRGILLSSASQIPEGSTVEVAVGVATLPDHGVQLSASGKVLRVQPKPSGSFAVAIEFERPFVLGLQTPDTSAPEERDRFPKARNRVVTGPGLRLAPAWYTET
ncbi:MAG TPA: PilZ domain-containing protein [Candidatus Sulfotelmatobacter sp.]